MPQNDPVYHDHMYQEQPRANRERARANREQIESNREQIESKARPNREQFAKAQTVIMGAMIMIKWKVPLADPRRTLGTWNLHNIEESSANVSIQVPSARTTLFEILGF